MNCYNGAKYLREAMDSVFAQSYQNWEIIFWDNQSSDNSAETCRSYGDPRVKYFYAPTHTVLYDARNWALAKCSGELIAFLDVDDWWVPEKLTIQIPLFDDHGVGMSCGNYLLVNERKGAASIRVGHDIVPSGEVMDALFTNYFVHISTLLVRRAAIDSLASGFDSRFNILGDFDFLVRLSAHWRLAAVQTPIAAYRWHGNNTGLRHTLAISDEFNVWYAESKNDPACRDRASFAVFAKRVRFYNVLRLLYAGKRRDAYRESRGLEFRQRLKVLAAIVLPNALVRWRLYR